MLFSSCQSGSPSFQTFPPSVPSLLRYSFICPLCCLPGSFDARCFSVCARFLLSSLCSASLWAFLILFSSVFIPPPVASVFSLCCSFQIFSGLPLALNSLPHRCRLLPHLPRSAVFALLAILRFFREGGRVRWRSGCSFRAFSDPRTPIYITCHGRSFPSIAAPLSGLGKTRGRQPPPLATRASLSKT